ncbi:MAG: prolipoprotein diacylglyceryl transferase [Deltaproteobacteria bacterium]|nr:prolipoprotein diacylglyceryl transferase [Deltaproteobacteria bacterium]
MVPYYPTPIFELGGLTLDAWQILVGLGILAGFFHCRQRAIDRRLSVKVTVDLNLTAVISGFLMAHVVHLLVYNWDKFVAEPHLLLPWYGGYSSTGGFLGAAIGVPLLLKLRKAPPWAYADNLAHGFVLAWFLGRTGCFFAHDHIGRLSDFPLAVAFPEGARHDLGLYEALFVLTLFVAMKLLDRRERFHGFYAGLAIAAYAPVRFGLDFLRAEDLESLGKRSDIRFLGLTPAQYGAIALLGLGVWILVHRRGKGREDISAEIHRDFPEGLPPGLQQDPPAED